LRTYELVVILQPNLEEEALDAAVGALRQVVVDNGGEIVRIESMGRRRLAYQIQKHSEGHYVLMYLNLERATILELERRLRLSDDVIRHLLVRLDEEMTPEPEAVEEPVESAEAPAEVALDEPEAEKEEQVEDEAATEKEAS
jgi:small subunit ribosomal protein S6